MRPHTQARRDAILCAVRDGTVVTCAEVCQAICVTCAERTPYHCYSRVYADLRAMTKAGLLWWTPAEGQMNATWYLAAKARELFVTDDLEAMWVAEA